MLYGETIMPISKLKEMGYIVKQFGYMERIYIVGKDINDCVLVNTEDDLINVLKLIIKYNGLENIDPLLIDFYAFRGNVLKK